MGMILIIKVFLDFFEIKQTNNYNWKGQFFDIPTLYMKKRDLINKFSTNIDNQLAQINMKIVNSLTKNMKYFDRSSINCNPECLVFERKIYCIVTLIIGA